ncbi:hypothetical protein COW36_14260 [bacterium (Candidatus Blackallbacteria) CG17_big_fil_post_rev_8_21_14_2_50_48_46]|uniref:DUF475 domain-containing protein n=1 Tax=bacterium (Candidatus Blackallbacteria) CG17_big_fil_post_rev_8_21_14_2_50_48_46 TaxID=2014261 RepID=A0A2M7G2S3_9BACT|nr:MAG: hypothetical protein COW64_08785 [bacterium (Candidatus Blackallbacteria) CG18_big_fil_WC_8_21_14_2_50_49_26]PIW16124.1 MAG: hypothetical protein COW36_14260 [bacterium (Candidatus Blackallbacteria) CG17_big_fil_post_rev_8_21_14_2_50_48_46]PIW45773.1 MAG: hypothetical protein COW20_18970 [bacterium (Candidatus Blackallbacteria) CG13_big_fil_rev_8_21_14_2_50_49_14]
MKYFKFSIAVTLIGLICAFFWGGPMGVLIAAILSVMEVSLSFDNAVVNASVLKTMDEKWRKRFLLWGIMIAVFGMRLLFPVLIVAMATGHSLLNVAVMALDNPILYAQQLEKAHVSIAAFGGMFLLLVFLSFVLDDNKEIHWIQILESGLSKLGKLESIEVVTALLVLMTAQTFVHEHERLTVLLSGLFGVVLFVLVGSFSSLFEEQGIENMLESGVKNAGAMSFIYLEILDASFSLDGVVGAFAITTDVVIIMIGLAIGAMFVRSLTVFLVEKGTLDQYIFLEHGAHYAIGALALLMFASIVTPVPEIVTGFVGLAFIGLSLISSILNKRRELA